MKPRVTLRKALEDPELLGSALAGPTWHAWRGILLAAIGEPLTKDELKTFTTFTGRTTPTSQRVDELWCCVGRRGGKSRAKVLLDYAEGTLQSTPILRQLLESRTKDTLTLTTGITLEVRSASFRRIRGVTCVAVLADECAFWMSDESANPDVEILKAARPALATTQGPLIAISSPYARRGALWDTYKKHFGPEGDPTILVAQGSTRGFNPELPQSIIYKAMDRDPAAAEERDIMRNAARN